MYQYAFHTASTRQHMPMDFAATTDACSQFTQIHTAS